ncbi:MAG: transcriptional regulator, MerR family [Ilumatobacteraceae bacterium]|nr:transcriptional regulator, MerR family [Ilumatobacteraceae bacterium]
MAGTLTIGDFARATHLSVKALRHYHRLGLLVPAEVDSSSGYRHYATGQIATAQIIRRFRDLDMPLDEIADVLTTDDLVTRNRLITGHLDRLEHSLAATQSAVRSLRDLLASSAPADIELRTVPRIRAAAITSIVDDAEIGPWLRGAFGELDATLAASGARPDGPAAGLYDTDLFAHGLGSATVFVPASAPIADVGRVRFVEIPAADLAVITHLGAHDDIDRAYGALATYVADHALSLDGPIRETYVTSFRDTGLSHRWLTEIGWPIFHPGAPRSDLPLPA